MPTWSGIRAKLEKEYLAPSLRGRIQYFATSYSKSPDHEGRASVRLDGKEILKSDYYARCMVEWQAQRKIARIHPELSRQESCQLAEQTVLDGGDFDQRDFYNAFREFANQEIESSLCSINPIVRMFALLDRRVGKRKLAALGDTMANELDWVRFFYDLRLEAEGLSISGR